MTRRFFFCSLLTILLLVLQGCQKFTRPIEPLPQLKIGVAATTQPMGTTDLLAGFIPEQRNLASNDALVAFDNALMEKLRTATSRTYSFLPAHSGANPSTERSAEVNSALEYWLDVARQNSLDMLIVPQILDWQERNGTAAGVTTSAGVILDFFLVDARNQGQLVKRSHYNEKQVGLSDNLMNLNLFLKRGGKWLTALDLAMEATDQMIQEFGL